MCGLSGYASTTISENARTMLVLALGAGIDDRGGHAAGYVSIESSSLRYARRLGEWMDAKPRFITSAAKGDICMMHARFATCGDRSIAEAHPYAIRRNGKVVLWGAHNGMIPDAWQSSKKNGRDCSVDSQELFELLADKDYEGIRSMAGYGVITWIDAEDPHHVNLVRLTDHSEICVVELFEGGIVWASTWKILSAALEAADLHAKTNFKLDDIGKVYQIHYDRVQETEVTGIKLSDDWGFTFASEYYFPSGSSYFPRHNSTDITDMDDLDSRWEEYLKEEESKEQAAEAERVRQALFDYGAEDSYSSPTLLLPAAFEDDPAVRENKKLQEANRELKRFLTQGSLR